MVDLTQLTDEELERAIAYAQRNKKPDPTFRDYARAAGQGLFGFGDELGAGLAATGAKAMTLLPGDQPGEGVPFGDIYRDIRDVEREGVEEFRKNYPGRAYGTEIATGLLGGGYGAIKAAQTAGKAAPQLTQKLMQATPPWMRATGGGAAAGSLYGAGMAEDSTAAGAVGGAAGGAVGGSLGYAIVNKVGIPMAKALWRRVSTAPRTEATRLVRQALEDTGLTREAAEAELKRLGPDAILADLEGQLTNLARTAHSQPTGPARKAAEDLLTQRDLKQQSQLWGLTRRLTGSSGKTYTTEKALSAAQKKASQKHYKEAYKVPINPTGALQDLMELKSIKSAYRLGREMAENTGGKAAVGKMFKDGEWVDFPQIHEWDWIQRGLNRRISTMLRAGDKAGARAVIKLRQRVLDELDAQNPAFGKARQTYAGHAAVKDAMEAGKKFITQDADMLDDYVMGLTASEKQGYMIGVTKAIRDQILRPGETRDITRIPLFQSPLIRERLVAVLGEENTDMIMDQAQRLAQMRRTKNTVMTRSPTADILAGQELGRAGSVMGGAAEAASGNVKSGLGQMLRSVTSPGQMTPETAQALAQLLFQKNPNLGPLYPKPLIPPNIPNLAPIYGGMGGGNIGGLLGVQ